MRTYVLQLDDTNVYEYKKLLRLQRRGKIKIVKMLIVVKVFDTSALGGFIANSNANLVRNAVIVEA